MIRFARRGFFSIRAGEEAMPYHEVHEAVKKFYNRDWDDLGSNNKEIVYDTETSFSTGIKVGQLMMLSMSSGFFYCAHQYGTGNRKYIYGGLGLFMTSRAVTSFATQSILVKDITYVD